MTATSLRIVHAANFARRQYGVIRRRQDYALFYGFIRNGFQAVEFSDRDTAKFESLLKSRHFGARACNRKLIETCENVKPHLVVLGHVDLITNKTLETIRALVPGVRIAYRNVDAVYVPAVVEKIERRKGLVDALFLSVAGPKLDDFAWPGTVTAFLPNLTDPALEPYRNFERTDLPVDVLFCGVGNTTDPRYALVGELRRELEQVRFRTCGMHGDPPVWGIDYDLAMADARMGLNLNRTEIGGLCVSDRIAHLMGNGLLTFMSRRSGYERIFGEDEAVFFDEPDELRAGILAHHADDDRRRGVAEAGWRAYRRLFGSERVARYLVERSLGLPASDDLSWRDERDGTA